MQNREEDEEEDDDDDDSAFVVCVECECVRQGCVVVFGGSKKDSKQIASKRSLSFSTWRALFSTSLLRLCISTTP